MSFNHKHNFAMVQEYSGIFHHGEQYVHWNPPCAYLVGALVTLVAIFTSQSKTLFLGMTSRRFCTRAGVPVQ